MHGDKFAEDIAIADFEPRHLASILHVLWIEANGGIGKDTVAFANLCGPREDCVRHHFAVFSQLDAFADDRIGPNRHCASEPGAGVDDGCGMGFHAAGISTTAKKTVASATTFPSTVVRPCILP